MSLGDKQIREAAEAICTRSPHGYMPSWGTIYDVLTEMFGSPAVKAFHQAREALDAVEVWPARTKVFRVQHAAAQAHVSMEQLVNQPMLADGTLWALQRAIFDAKMNYLRWCVTHGHVPIADPGIEAEVIVRIHSRVIDVEAGEYADRIQPNMRELTLMVSDTVTLKETG